MEASQNKRTLTSGVFQVTMEAFSEEQAANTRALGELAEAIKALTQRAEHSGGHAEVPEGIREDIATIRKAVCERPLGITRKFQLLLFPEQDRKLFYRVVFGRWLAWLTAMLLLNNLYHFAVNWTNKKSEVELIRLQNDRTRKAWEILYRDAGPRTRASMDGAYQRSGEEEKRPQ